jgi:hypothetical protein
MSSINLKTDLNEAKLETKEIKEESGLFNFEEFKKDIEADDFNKDIEFNPEI